MSKTNLKVATSEDFFTGETLDLVMAFLDEDPFDDEIEQETFEVIALFQNLQFFFTFIEMKWKQR